MSDPSEKIRKSLMKLGFDPTQTASSITIPISGGGSDSGAIDRLPRVRTRSSPDLDADLEIGQMLGSGGMGIVALAHQTALERDVAVKYARPDKDSTALLHEALVMGYVEHPNVVPVHAVGRTEDGAPLVVMKRIEGVSWGDVLEDPLVAPTDVVDQDFHLDILIQVCNVLRFAHERRIIHRDIKPDNVMLGSFGEVYVVDWGIAVSLDPTVGPRGIMHRDAARAIAGTPNYMAPETATDLIEEVDEQTDVFLLGATLHEILTGEPPNAAKTSFEAVMRAFRCEDKEYAPTVDPELVSIARRAMAREKEYRFGSVAEFQEALKSFLDHRESLTLTRVAERNYDQIIDAFKQDREPPTRLIVETRFALRHALNIWPKNPRAIETLSVLSRAAFEYWLHHGDLAAAAEALLDIREADRADAEARLEKARRVARSLEREVNELRRDRDFEIDSRPRLLLGATIAITWGVIAWYKAVARWGVPLDELHYDYLGSLLPTVVIPLVAFLIFRKLFDSNEVNRRIVLFFFIGLFTVAMIRITGWRFDVPVHVATAMEFVVYGLLAMSVGIVTTRSMYFASFLIIGAAVLGVAFPAHQALFMAVAFTFFAPIVAYLWRVK